MDIKTILGQDTLPEEILVSLQEAFDKKVQEAREEAEMSVREELAQRYEHDRDNLVEALDNSLTDVVKSYEAQKADEIQKLREAQEKFHAGVKEAKAAYKSKMREHLENANSFVAKHLAEEIKNLRAERSALAEARVEASAC